VPKPSAVIVGAGAGGLAIANLLAYAGWKVSVYEQQERAGGRASVLEIDGFRFDTGPSWYLMPEVFEHYFSLLDRQVSSYMELSKLSPAYKVFYDYHEPITIRTDKSLDEATFEDVEPGSDTKLAAYLSSAERAYRLAKKYFLYNTFQSKRSIFHPEVLRHGLQLTRNLSQSLESFVEHTFTELPLQQILEYPAVFLATSPTKAPALYHLMSHLDFEQGVLYPTGGLYALIESLEAIGRELGVQYHFSAPVKAIKTSSNRADGIILTDGKEIKADIIISNADLHYTETMLLPKEAQSYPERSWRRKTSGPSALLLYLGVRGKLPNLVHHNLLFMKDWKANFAAIFESKNWPDKPSMYICKPSATDAMVAPDGYENVFVLVPLPAKTDYRPVELEQYAERCIELIAQTCELPGLVKDIVLKRMYGPADFAEQLHAWQGSALGLGHTLFQSAFFRPANRSRKLSNLYYVGGDTQPGIGLPMCIIGAELVYKYLINDRSAGPLTSLRRPSGGWHV
jgi:phytoene desaturase